MGRKILIGLGLIVGILLACYFLGNWSPSHKHIFINETSDHRFDESIRISILAGMNRTQIQNAVVISDKFNPSELEAKAAELFESLQVGAQQNGRGILYLFSPANHALKIEVGYALEGILPDAAIKGFELAAKTFIYSDRYQDFWAELINTLNIEAFEREKSSGSDTEEAYDFSKFRFLSGGAGISSHFYSPTSDQWMSESRGPGTSTRFPASEQLDIAIETYLNSLKEGANDTNMDILAKESKLFRQITPLTSYNLFRNWRMYSKARTHQTFREGPFAFVFFKSNSPVLPLIFKKENSQWKVEEAMSWSLFHRFEDSMKVFLKYPLSGMSNDFYRYVKEEIGDPLYPLNKDINIFSLEKNHFQESDWRFLYFKLFWLSKVNESLKPLRQLSTDDIWIFADVFLNLGKMSDFSKAYGLAASRMPGNAQIQKNAKFYRDLIRFKDSEWLLK